MQITRVVSGRVSKNAIALVVKQLPLDDHNATEEGRLFTDYLPNIADEIKISASHPSVRSLTAANVEALDGTKGKQGGPDAKWFGDHTAGHHVLKTRFRRQLLVDLSLIIASSNPFSMTVNPKLTLDEIFDECGQGAVVASYLYQDPVLFEAARFNSRFFLLGVLTFSKGHF